ncbi:putative lipoprotein lprH [Mycobacterium ulcerans str. Harvey]|uniref:Lipoprotein lprH n=1 Tax=Mycobacterium ulcerans str. Harvey TaxID=1299332 RepID=A0ABN0R9S2_MYCUL|nr:putative lipoprotein lprH [Mycobacterium ulcerans str. Harvey]
MLLQDGDNTAGAGVFDSGGQTYFTSARPPECTAAVLFKGSPLRPPGSADFAESAYRVQATAMYAESVDVYNSR